MQRGTFGAGPRQEFSKTSRPGEFKLEPFTPQKSCTGFQCAVAEYNDCAERLAWACNMAYCAAHFLTVDADTERDEGVLAFYRKNDFVQNAELFNKNRKTISMRKDIYS